MARRTEAAQLLKAVASVILNTSHDEVADIVTSQNAKWIFSESTQVGVRWTGDCIIVCEPPQINDQVLEVPATRPRVVIITTPDEGRKKVLRISPWKYGWTRATKLPRLIKTAAGAEYRLDDARETWETLQRAFEAKTILSGIVKSRWRDGYRIDIGLDAFLSERRLLLSKSKLVEPIGSIVDVVITSINQEKQKINVALGQHPIDAQPQSDVWQELQKRFDANEKVVGLVTAVGHSGCAVEVMNLQTFLPLEELQPSEKQTAKDLVGKTLDFCIIGINTNGREIRLTRRFEELNVWQELQKRFDANEKVAGLVTAVGHSGCAVEVLGLKSILPLGEFQPSEEQSGQNLVGKTLDFSIVQIDTKKRAVSLTRRSEELASWRELVLAMNAKKTISANIQAIVSGGLIADVGVKAFVPTSQLEIAPPTDLSSYVGHTFDFRIQKLNWERRNVVLGRRELLVEKLAERRAKLLAEIKPGDVRKGVVKNIVDFGAFIDLGGVDGLLHITDMGWGKVGHPTELVRVGQEFNVIVLEVNREKGHVTLGLKQLIPNPWNTIETKYPVGTRVKVRVSNVVPYGAFVELEPGAEGLIHISEFSWDRNPPKASEVFKEGDEVEAVVLSVNGEEQKIALSIRQLLKNPWDTADQRYPVGKRVRGRVTNILSYGAFVELEPGINGMIHVSDLSATREITDPSEVFQKGDTVVVVVLSVDKTKQRIALGMKQIES